MRSVSGFEILMLRELLGYSGSVTHAPKQAFFFITHSGEK